MSTEPTKTPAPKADKAAESKGHSLLDDAKAALPQRKADEAKAKEEHDQLEKDGKIAPPNPLIGYETARERLTTPDEEAK